MRMSHAARVVLIRLLTSCHPHRWLARDKLFAQTIVGALSNIKILHVLFSSESTPSTTLTWLSVAADKHGVSVTNVATRWVIEQPAVAGAIVGARLGLSDHSAENLK
jgi:aryl-alcohol dehydrogenase-like predicted oxidoreductase